MARAASGAADRHLALTFQGGVPGQKPNTRFDQSKIEPKQSGTELLTQLPSIGEGKQASALVSPSFTRHTAVNSFKFELCNNTSPGTLTLWFPRGCTGSISTMQPRGDDGQHLS